VLEGLLSDIRERATIAPELARIDFIIFSGDIAWSGKAEEYLVAEKYFLEPLLEAAGLGDRDWSRLFVVPGNHDVDRNKFGQVSREVINSLAEPTPGAMNDCLYTKRKLEALLSPLSDYSQFASQCGVGDGTENSAYFYVSSLEVDDKRIAIVGLNSAWWSGRNLDINNEVKDYGNLIAGERQAYSALRKLKDLRNVDLRIAVVHHPFGWLTGFDRDRVEKKLYDECHFILHGHEHLPRVNVHRSTLGDVI
jgi:predicted phosphodiesterase